VKFPNTTKTGIIYQSSKDLKFIETSLIHVLYQGQFQDIIQLHKHIFFNSSYQFIILGRDLFHLKEDMLWVKKLGIDLVWCLVPLTDDKDFGRLVTRGSRLGCVHSFEELVQNPDDGRVIFRSENLRNKCTILKREKKNQMTISELQHYNLS
jgi:hypothetical protein